MKTKKDKKNRELFDELIDRTLKDCQGDPKTEYQKEAAKALQNLESTLSKNDFFSK